MDLSVGGPFHRRALPRGPQLGLAAKPPYTQLCLSYSGYNPDTRLPQLNLHAHPMYNHTTLPTARPHIHSHDHSLTRHTHPTQATPTSLRPRSSYTGHTPLTCGHTHPSQKPLDTKPMAQWTLPIASSGTKRKKQLELPPAPSSSPQAPYTFLTWTLEWAGSSGTCFLVGLAVRVVLCPGCAGRDTESGEDSSFRVLSF